MKCTRLQKKLADLDQSMESLKQHNVLVKAQNEQYYKELIESKEALSHAKYQAQKQIKYVRDDPIYPPIIENTSSNHNVEAQKNYKPIATPNNQAAKLNEPVIRLKLRGGSSNQNIILEQEATSTIKPYQKNIMPAHPISSQVLIEKPSATTPFSTAFTLVHSNDCVFLKVRKPKLVNLKVLNIISNSDNEKPIITVTKENNAEYSAARHIKTAEKKKRNLLANKKYSSTNTIANFYCSNTKLDLLIQSTSNYQNDSLNQIGSSFFPKILIEDSSQTHSSFIEPLVPIEKNEIDPNADQLQQSELLEKYKQMNKYCLQLEEHVQKEKQCNDELIDELERLTQQNEQWEEEDSHITGHSLKPKSIKMQTGLYRLNTLNNTRDQMEPNSEDRSLASLDIDVSEYRSILKIVDDKVDDQNDIRCQYKAPKTKTESKKIIDMFLERMTKKKKFILRNLFGRKPMFKYITSIYHTLVQTNKESLKLTNQFQMKTPLHEYVYHMMLNKYGNEKFTKLKYRQFLRSLMAFHLSPRVNLFMGFMGLLKNFKEDEINFYLKALNFINNSKLAVTVQNIEVSNIHFVPYPRIQELCRNALEKNLSKEEIIDLRKKVEAIKQNDPKKINISGIIDIDAALKVVLEFNQIVIKKMRTPMEDVFLGIDLDGNNMINFYEFNMMFLFFSSTTYNVERAKNIFNSNISSENPEKHEGVPMIQFAQLVEICRNEGLLSDLTQNKFLLHTDARLDHFFCMEMLHRFNDLMGNIKERFSISHLSDYIAYIMRNYKQRIDSRNPILERSMVLYRHMDHI